MEIKQLISELDKHTKAEAKKIEAYFYSGEQFSSELFDTPVHIDESLSNLRQLWGRKGVYLFKAVKSIELDQKAVGDWNKIQGGSFVWWTPKKVNSGDCFYIGKADKSLYSRVKQHYSNMQSRTSALLLGHPNRQVMRNKLECLAFPVKKEFASDEYKMLLKAVEKSLQNNLDQLCGVKN